MKAHKVTVVYEATVWAKSQKEAESVVQYNVPNTLSTTVRFPGILKMERSDNVHTKTDR